MSLFSALPGVLSLFGDASQYRQGSNLVNSGQNWINQAVNNSGSAYQNALALLQQRQAQGAYDASAALKLAGDQAAHDLTLNDQNTAGQLATLGYKRGDSPFQQDAAQNSAQANLALRQQLLAAQDAYQQKYNRDMGLVNGVGNAYNNLLMNAGNGNVQRGQALQQSAYGGLGGLISGGGLDGLGSMF